MQFEVSVDDGKYKVLFDNGKLHAERHGEAWRDCTGDKLIYWLAVELNQARDRLNQIKKVLNEEM